jgi:oligoendopeptidase F
MTAHSISPLFLVTVCVVAALSCAVSGRAAEATWNLTDLYPDDAAWEKAKTEVPGLLAAVEPYRGHLGDSAASLASGFEALYRLRKETARLGTYASLLSDMDTRKPGPQGMKQAISQLRADVRARTAWFDPELLALPPTRLDSLLASEPRLTPYRRHLERLAAKRPHTLDARGEEIMGLESALDDDGDTVAGLLLDAEIPWPTITLSDGSSLRVDVAGYSRGRALPSRVDRVATYTAFYGELSSFQQALAASLATTVKGHNIKARVRSYPSTLEASLAESEVDPAVYEMLVREVNASLPTLHRYLKLRARMLGVGDLAYFDLYPSLVKDVQDNYPWPAATETVLAALQPMGSDYVDYLRRAFAGGWVDVYPREGKRSGAYMAGSAYDVHPYMLLNHLDDYDSTSTLAHEAGHMMHSAYTNRAQAYPTADYETFVAEVASVTNEWLLFDYTLEHASSDDEKLAILGQFLESARTTVFRQTMFAEFELAIHRMIESGRPLTSESLGAAYLELLRRYHGHDQGVCRIDDAYATEWAFVPHFHYNYYVYAYATSFIAANAFSENILTGTHGGAQGYVDRLLKAGSSKPPVQLLKDAGVDMTTPAPFQSMMRAMNRIMDQMEEILGRKAK